jgi:hypothetical protein
MAGSRFRAVARMTTTLIESLRGEGRKVSFVDQSDPGKSGIEELVQGLGAGLGIDPIKLVFKWDRKTLEPPEPGIDPRQQLLVLTIYLGKKSEVLSFTEDLVQSSIENAFGFISAYTDLLIAALRRLKQPE